MTPIRITNHAIARIAQHHEQADLQNILAMLDRAIPIEQGVAAGLLCRASTAVLDEYRLAADRRGLFVIVENPHRDMPGKTVRVLVTYVRFEASQVAAAWSLYPAVEEMRVAA